MKGDEVERDDVRIKRQGGLFLHLLQSLRVGTAAVVNLLGMGSIILVIKVNIVTQYLPASSFML